MFNLFIIYPLNDNKSKSLRTHKIIQPTDIKCFLRSDLNKKDKKIDVSDIHSNFFFRFSIMVSVIFSRPYLWSQFQSSLAGLSSTVSGHESAVFCLSSGS